MYLKKIVKQFKQSFLSEELSLPEAKILAMLAVIYSDEKVDMSREMGLLEALCAFDHRLAGFEPSKYIQQFREYENNLDDLFEKLAESIHARDDKMDLLSSAYLLASIDGYISKEETQILHRLGNTLRMTLEDINTVTEHSEYVTNTLRSSHRVGEGHQETKSNRVSLPEAKILAMLAVINSDEKKEVNRELSLLAALCSFDADLDLELIHVRFQEFQNNLDHLLEILSDLKIEKTARIDLLSSAFLLAGIDGEISNKETEILERLAGVFDLTQDDILTAKSRSHSLIDTMKELRVLS
ncbi:MAG: TerB family tellurite resistance protein [SAR324 cluster bacterium]|nr:TerB family tellurite resistance protein [SAR324 cluster bacterium]